MIFDDSLDILYHLWLLILIPPLLILVEVDIARPSLAAMLYPIVPTSLREAMANIQEMVFLNRFRKGL